MRLLGIGLALLLVFSGIGCSKQQEQVQKPGTMTITMRSTSTLAGLFHPSESPSAGAKVRVENVSIETGTFTCTADTGLVNEEAGQLRLVGNVVIRTVDGVEIMAEEAVLQGRSPAENSHSVTK